MVGVVMGVGGLGSGLGVAPLVPVTATVCVVTVCAGLLFRRLKRGRPPGALIHLAHQLELIRIPGAVRPRARRYSPSAAGGFE